MSTKKYQVSLEFANGEILLEAETLEKLEESLDFVLENIKVKPTEKINKNKKSGLQSIADLIIMKEKQKLKRKQERLTRKKTRQKRS